MSWSAIQGHASLVEQFRRTLVSGRLATAYLFTGPPGIGKRTFALQFARSLLCQRRSIDDAESCDQCPSCLQVATGSHPDLIQVARPKDKSFIPVEKFIGRDEHRMQEGLCHDLSLKPFYGGRKIAMIDDADSINKEGANCLLKTLEEPPAGSVLILIGTSPQRQLPTIRSRCQLISFGRLSREEMKSILATQHLVEDDSDVNLIAQLSGGSISQAVLMCEPGAAQWRGSWLQQLASLDPGQRDYVKELQEWIDGAGSDTAAKRDRLRLAGDIAIEFYHHAILQLSAADRETQDSVFERCLEAATQPGMLTPWTASQCLARSLDLHPEIAANANPALLIECWLADLASLARGEFVDAAYR